MKHSICFFGTGRICARHAKIVKSLVPNALLAVASRDGGRARSFMERLELDARFGDYSSAMGSDFETVVIGIPPRHHRGLIEAALESGKNLLIEKPIANSMDELTELWPRLKSSRGVVMVGENHWYAPFHRKVRDCLRGNDLGRPISLELIRVGIQKNEGWRCDSSEMSLGALHEGGVHWIRRLLDLAGIYEEDPLNGVLGVKAETPPESLTGMPYEDTMTVIARHRSGLTSRLFHSWGTPRRGILKDISSVRLEGGELRFDSRGIFGFVRGGLPKLILPPLSDFGGFAAMWRDFLRAIEEGGAPALTLEEIFADFAYMDAAYRSLRSGEEEAPIPLPASR